MKWVMDIDALVRDAVISATQAREIRRRATDEMVTVAVNLLLVAGIVAVVAGTSAFLDDAAGIAAFGAIVLWLGIAGLTWLDPRYRLPANAAAVIGASMFLGGTLWWAELRFDTTLFAVAIWTCPVLIPHLLWGKLRFPRYAMRCPF